MSASPGEEPLPPHLIELAEAVGDLGEALIGRQVPAEEAAAFRDVLRSVTTSLQTFEHHTKAEGLSSRNRVAVFLETGEWPPPAPDGARIEFDPWSLVGGELNPFSIGARYVRDGDEVVGTVDVKRCFEGPPERVHGGVICAIFDEVLGSVFRALGTASAFTGELSVRFERPAPLDAPLTFRGRQVGAEGRRRFLSGEATDPDGVVVATATAVFIEMKPDQYGISADRPS